MVGIVTSNTQSQSPNPILNHVYKFVNLSSGKLVKTALIVCITALIDLQQRHGILVSMTGITKDIYVTSTDFCLNTVKPVS